MIGYLLDVYYCLWGFVLWCCYSSLLRPQNELVRYENCKSRLSKSEGWWELHCHLRSQMYVSKTYQSSLIISEGISATYRWKDLLRISILISLKSARWFMSLGQKHQLFFFFVLKVPAEPHNINKDNNNDRKSAVIFTITCHHNPIIIWPATH